MKVYFEILKYGRPYFKFLFRALFFLIIFNLFSVLSLTLLIPFLEILFSENPVTKPLEPFIWYSLSNVKAWGFFWLSENMQVYGKMTVLIYFCIFLWLSILLKNIFRYFSSWNIALLEESILQSLRTSLFNHLIRLPLNFYSKRKKGEIIAVVINDVQIVQESIIGTLQTVFSDPITMIFFLFTMFFISWKLTLFTFLILPITGFAISRIAKSLKKRANKAQIIFDKILSTLEEFLSGIRIVKAFHAEPYEYQKYYQFNEDYKVNMVSYRRRSDLASPLTEVLSILVVIFMILFGANMILSGNKELKASEFIGFIALFSQFIAPIKTFSSAISRIQKGIVSYQRIKKLLAEEKPVSESEDGIIIDTFKQAIKVENLYFRYENKNKYALENINFTLKKGQTLALVGPSGGGKSTLVDLICRFYEPTHGNIFIDGIPLNALHAGSFRKMMGIVTQEGILFHDTVANNIAYANPHASMEQIMKAAKIANAHDFIMQLPNGYDTFIGERGTMLSGGQRQRIAIARAILKNPQILILDEATSALDNESEKLVQEALNHLMKNRTSIVIAHRLSTILHADMILVIEEGKIIESGNHEQLLKQNGLYNKLYQLQFLSNS